MVTAVIDPGSLLRRAQREESPPPEVGLALLLDGEAQLYQLIAPKSGWPQVGEAVSPRADARNRLLAAVVAHLWAAGDAEGMYLRLTRSRESEISTVAALLLAYLYSDTGQLPKAIELLSNQSRISRTPAEESLLRLQLSLRLAEVPDYDAAVVECDQVARLSSRVKPRPWSEALRMLAIWNRFGYLWSKGVYSNALELPAKGEAALLVRPSVSYANALADYLNTTFEASLSDPSSRSVRFQSRDPVESNLTAAVIHCELIGDSQEVRRARTLLGRYLVLTRLGTPQGVPPAALELMRRGGDDKGIQQAARTVHRLGPLGPLQLATQGLVDRRDLGGADPQASLRLLAVGADVLGEDAAAMAVSQLLGAPDFVSHQWADAPAALAGLVRVAPIITQTEVALFVRAHAADPVNAVFVQELARVVRAIRWEVVDPSERSLWLDFIAEGLNESTEAHYLAVQATLALARVEATAIEKILTDRLSAEPSLETLGLVCDALDNPPRRTREGAWEIIQPALRQARDQAHAGSYQFPSIDIASLATAVLRDESRNAAGWEELVAFLLDKAVAMSSKVGAFEALANPSTWIPPFARQQLKASLWEVTGFEDPLFSRPDEFAAALLKLAGRVGATSRDNLLAALLELSGSPSVASRVAAAGAISPLKRRVGPVVAATLALALSRDGNHDVRAAAGNAIAELGESGDPLLQRSLEARVIELLREPGVTVPHGVLRGLYAGLSRGQTLPPAVSNEVEQLTKRHLSRAIRDWAEEVSRPAPQPPHNPKTERSP